LRARDGSSELAAETLVAFLSPEGWVTRAEAAGGVTGSRQTATEREDLSAAAASLDLWPKVSQPKQIDLNGSVVLATRATNSSESRTLHTNIFQMHFSTPAEGRSSKLRLAQTLAPGALEWTDASNGAATQLTKLKADSLEMRFGVTGKPGLLLANGNM